MLTGRDFDDDDEELMMICFQAGNFMVMMRN